jgi:hypothetical protein
MSAVAAFLALVRLPRLQQMENAKVCWHIISTMDFTVQLRLMGSMFSGLEDSKEIFGLGM